ADNRPYDHREPAQPLEMEFRRSRGRRESGSMALDFAWLAAGRLDVVSYERSERLWDYIGGELLVAQAGGEIRIADPARDIAVAASPELVEYLCPTKDE
ncbi:MAG TPA: inositol monophosphatase family protein, partial [Solirubrobacterales bacterium]|nr:inositol monophosphatase family protein [Solirubrobacterales bacterium]